MTCDDFVKKVLQEGLIPKQFLISMHGRAPVTKFIHVVPCRSLQPLQRWVAHWFTGVLFWNRNVGSKAQSRTSQRVKISFFQLANLTERWESLGLDFPRPEDHRGYLMLSLSRWLRLTARHPIATNFAKAAATGTATGTAIIITGPVVTGTPAWVGQPKVQHVTSESAS